MKLDIPFITIYNPYLIYPQDFYLPFISAACWFFFHHFVFSALKKFHNVPEQQNSSSKSSIAAAALENTDNHTENNEDKYSARMKLAICNWKAIQYSLASAFGIYALSQCDWTFDTEQYFKNWPVHPMSTAEKIYYQMGYGMALFNLIYLPFEPVRLKDFSVYAIHHVVTLYLIHVSYTLGFHRAGAAILLCHDVADPFMETAKCFLYQGYEKMANLLFGMFALVFVITRNIIFPFLIIRSIFKYGYHPDGSIVPYGETSKNFGARAALLILEAMHIYWAFLIMKTAQRALSPKGIKDVREKEE